MSDPVLLATLLAEEAQALFDEYMRLPLDDDFSILHRRLKLYQTAIETALWAVRDHHAGPRPAPSLQRSPPGAVDLTLQRQEVSQTNQHSSMSSCARSGAFVKAL